MSIDLCGTCGGSWPCEHREPLAIPPPVTPGHVMYSADARGKITTQDLDVDQAIRYPPLPTAEYSREQLEEAITAIVQPAARGLAVQRIVERLGWNWGDHDQRRHVNNAIARLVRRDVLYKGRTYHSSGLIMPYTIEAHRGEVRWLLYSIDDHELAWAEAEMRHAQEKIESLRRKRKALQKELQGLGAGVVD